MTNIQLHFFDLRYVGSPSLGQPVSFDSLLFTEKNRTHHNWKIRLRPDVVFDPIEVEQSDAYNHVNAEGVSEYEWVKEIEPFFSAPQTLHIGAGCSGRAYDHLRYALYRSLSTLPAHGSTHSRHMLDLLTLLRAMAFLRPSAMPIKIDPRISDSSLKSIVYRLFPGSSDADTVLQLASAMRNANPRLFSYGLKCSSVAAIGKVMGLVNGHIETLSTLKPVFMCHDALLHHAKFGAFMPMGTDPEYPGIVYMVDLSCDISELLECQDEPARFFRNHPTEIHKPLVRVSLTRFPFAVGLSALEPEGWKKAGLDRAAVFYNAQLLRSQQELSLALCEYSLASTVEVSADPEFQLLSSDYGAADISLLKRIHTEPMTEWVRICRAEAHDQRIARLAESLIRRSFSPILNSGEDNAWRNHCVKRLINNAPAYRVEALTEYCKSIVGTPTAPAGLKTVARHWLGTIKS